MIKQEELTNREIEVLALSTFGLTIPVIAKLLVISEYTVKNHFNASYAKLNVHKRVQAAVKFIKMGFEVAPNEKLSNEYNKAIIELIKSPPKRKPEW